MTYEIIAETESVITQFAYSAGISPSQYPVHLVAKTFRYGHMFGKLPLNEIFIKKTRSVYTTKFARILRHKEGCSTTLPLVTRNFTVEAARQRHISQKDTVMISQAGYGKASSPTYKLS